MCQARNVCVCLLHSVRFVGGFHPHWLKMTPHWWLKIFAWGGRRGRGKGGEGKRERRGGEGPALLFGQIEPCSYTIITTLRVHSMLPIWHVPPCMLKQDRSLQSTLVSIFYCNCWAWQQWIVLHATWCELKQFHLHILVLVHSMTTFVSFFFSAAKTNHSTAVGW